MDNATDWILNHVVMNISTVRAHAAANNGQCVWRFSQVKDPVRAIISLHPGSRGGICAMLSAHWLASEHRGEQLQGRLGHARHDLDHGMLGTIATQHAMASAGNRQEDNIDGWMQSQGLVFDRRELLGTGAAGGHFSKDELLDTIETRIAARDPSYAFISFSGRYAGLGTQGHIVAGVFGSAGARFFDPNYGAFTFASSAS